MPRDPRLDDAGYQEELRRYRSPAEWPYDVLPVKRYVPRSASGIDDITEVGYVCEGGDGEALPVVTVADDRLLVYDSLEALVEDGWLVD